MAKKRREVYQQQSKPELHPPATGGFATLWQKFKSGVNAVIGDTLVGQAWKTAGNFIGTAIGRPVLYATTINKPLPEETQTAEEQAANLEKKPQGAVYQRVLTQERAAFKEHVVDHYTYHHEQRTVVTHDKTKLDTVEFAQKAAFGMPVKDDVPSAYEVYFQMNATFY